VFTTVQLSPAGNAAVDRVWGPMTMDPTDLLALPALAASWAWLRRGDG
jgi:hypothetical protein